MWINLVKLLWSYHQNHQKIDKDSKDSDKNNKSLWYQLLEHCWSKDTKDVESWMEVFNLINNDCDIESELTELIQKHDAKIAKQVSIATQNGIKIC